MPPRQLLSSGSSAVGTPLKKTFILMAVFVVLVSISAALVPSTTAGSAWTRTDSKVAKAGDTVSFDISLSTYSGVSQDGWTGDIYALAAVGLPSGWSAKFYYGSDEITSINGKLGETVTITMDISTTSTTAAGDYYFTFSATGQSGTASLSLKLQIRAPVRQLEMTSAYPYASKEVGEMLTYPVTITNGGETNEFLTLNATVPTGWSIQFLTADNRIIHGLYLGSGQSQPLTVQFTPSATVGAGTASFNITATSEDSLANATLTLRADIYQETQKVELTSELPYLSAKPGETLTYSATIKNSGSDALFILSALELPEGWTDTFKSGTSKIQSIYLESGASASFTVEVTTPATAEAGSYDLTIRASATDGTASTDLEFRGTITPQHRELSLSSAYPHIFSESGLTISYPVTVSNDGERDEQLNLSAVAPEGWKVCYTAADMSGAMLKSLYLAAGSTKSLVFEATPPDGAPLGEYAFTLNVVSADGTVSASLALTTNTVAPEGKLSVLSTFTEVTTEAGKTLSYPITIKNGLSTDTTFLLLVLSEPQNWETVFLSEDTEVSRVLLTSGQSIDLVVQTTPPRSVEIGNYTTSIKVESDDGAVSQQIDLKAKIVGSFSLEITPTAYNARATTGETASFTVKVTNTGESAVTSLRLDTAAPDGWEVSSTPLQVQSLAAGESTTFTLTLKSAADATAGDYMASVKASSDQIDTDEIQLRVTLDAPTSWVYAGVILAIIAIAAMVIIFRKFGRR